MVEERTNQNKKSIVDCQYQARLDELHKYMIDLRNTLKDVYQHSNNEDMISDLMKDRSDDRMLAICLDQKSDFEDVILDYDEKLEILECLKSLKVSDSSFKKK